MPGFLWKAGHFVAKRNMKWGLWEPAGPGEADWSFWLWFYFCPASTQPGRLLTEALDVTQRLAASLATSVFHQLQATRTWPGSASQLAATSCPLPLSQSL